LSIPHHDFIIDPLAIKDLDSLGQILADPQVEKIFHAAEYDIMLLKRQYKWQITNLFDTMWAARILGYKRYGLASLLKEIFGVHLDKRYQKSNWCKRPLSSDQLTYAQLDTHYLIPLRNHLAQQLQATGHMEEALETFDQQTRVEPATNEFDPESFWSITGARDLRPHQQAVLKALTIYRDHEARRRNKPHFKIMGDKTLLELATKLPTNTHQLSQIYGMTNGQIRRYGQRLLQVIRDARKQPPPRQNRRNHHRPSEAITNRYEKLHEWRKKRARKRGVESDVIISRDALWAIARQNPQTLEELARLPELGKWRAKTYGEEILAVLQNE
ncbi:MAG: hypothetical protein D6706_14380, partial [Chloroflexi bacterium]